MTDDKIIKVLRAQAWERAKGELMAVLNSYWGEPEKFERMNKEVKNFIATVQDEGLQE